MRAKPGGGRHIDRYTSYGGIAIVNIRFPSSPPPAEVPVSAPGPHPALQVGAPNRYYAQLLSQDIAYTKGEMSAIYQYLYQQWRTNEQYPEFAGTLLRIAKVEMEHLEMLGKLIVLLGGDPRCQTQLGNRFTFWNGNMVFYGRPLSRMLQNDIRSERDARDLYLSQARFVKDEELSAVLARIAADEEVHLALFQSFLARFEAGKLS
nr:ferritin family protein [Harryflintia acetispora]